MAKFLIVEARFYDHLNDMLLAGIQLFPGQARPVAIRVIEPDEQPQPQSQQIQLTVKLLQVRSVC